MHEIQRSTPATLTILLVLLSEAVSILLSLIPGMFREANGHSFGGDHVERTITACSVVSTTIILSAVMMFMFYWRLRLEQLRKALKKFTDLTDVEHYKERIRNKTVRLDGRKLEFIDLSIKEN